MRRLLCVGVALVMMTGGMFAQSTPPGRRTPSGKPPSGEPTAHPRPAPGDKRAKPPTDRPAPPAGKTGTAKPRPGGGRGR